MKCLSALWIFYWSPLSSVDLVFLSHLLNLLMWLLVFVYVFIQVTVIGPLAAGYIDLFCAGSWLRNLPETPVNMGMACLWISVWPPQIAQGFCSRDPFTLQHLYSYLNKLVQFLQHGNLRTLFCSTGQMAPNLLSPHSRMFVANLYCVSTHFHSNRLERFPIGKANSCNTTITTRSMTFSGNKEASRFRSMRVRQRRAPAEPDQEWGTRERRVG